MHIPGAPGRAAEGRGQAGSSKDYYESVSHVVTTVLVCAFYWWQYCTLWQQAKAEEDIAADPAVVAELQREVEDLKLRLHMAAEHYKEKYKECQRLQKQVLRLSEHQGVASRCLSIVYVQHMIVNWSEVLLYVRRLHWFKTIYLSSLCFHLFHWVLVS